MHPPVRSQDTDDSSYEEEYEETVLDEVTTDGSEEGDSQSEEEEGRDGEDEALSLDDLLQEKNTRIDALERANRMKDERLQLLQQKLNETKVKNKEGIYWLQTELDNARRENEATEEQMAELMSDLQGMTQISNPNDISKEVIREDIINNYEEALAAMDNQIIMIKTSAGNVVNSLKEEIADLMEDRASMEVDLLNQLAVLNNEKINREEEFENELKTKKDVIHRLMSAGGTATTSDESAGLEEYELEIGRLMDIQKNTQEKLSKARGQANEEIQRLELANAQLKSDLERAEDDLAMMQSENSAEETMQTLHLLSKEREDTIETLGSVAAIWEKADAAIVALENSMDQLRPDETVAVKGDRERLLSTLETAALVHGQIKISLMLIELKLRNQLQNLKNDKLGMGQAGTDEQTVVEQMKTIQTDALKVLSQVEAKLTGQIREMETQALEETKLMKNAIQQRSTTLEAMQLEHKALEAEIARLKSAPQNNQQVEETKSSSEWSSHSTALNEISKAIVDQLQLEVLRILERVKEKNNLIQAMKVKVEEHTATEDRLKKELKRALRKPATPTKSQGSSKSASDTIPRSPKPVVAAISPKPMVAAISPKAVVTAISPKAVVAAISPHQSPKAFVAAISPSPTTPTTKSPSKSNHRRASVQNPITLGNSNHRRASVQNPIKSPKGFSSPVPMLKPSPREISKSRLSFVGLLSPEQLTGTKKRIPKSNSSN
jgi:hypothetical protein